MRVLLTGSCGFIGFHVAKQLLAKGCEVLGFDNLNDYYSPIYKNDRLSLLSQDAKFIFCRGNLENSELLDECFSGFKPTHVIHLAAQAGVRYSIENPTAYINSNIVGFQNVIELVRKFRPTNFVFASSSSVYGGSKVLPFTEDQEINNPMSLYAATKAANELVARTYSNMYDLPTTGLRFFTVYGPHGRPDMALFKFANAISKGETIPLFNNGDMIRDFTYVDDIVEGVIAAVERPKRWAIYNLGRGKPEKLMEMVHLLEKGLGRKAMVENLPFQLGDLEATHASIERASADLNYFPKTGIEVGIPKFVEWYKQFHSR